MQVTVPLSSKARTELIKPFVKTVKKRKSKATDVSRIADRFDVLHSEA